MHEFRALIDIASHLGADRIVGVADNAGGVDRHHALVHRFDDGRQTSRLTQALFELLGAIAHPGFKLLVQRLYPAVDLADDLHRQHDRQHE